MSSSDPLEWQDQAECLDAPIEMFYPEIKEPQALKRHQRKIIGIYCFYCPVIVECLVQALEKREDFGIWGGTIRDERRRLRNGGVSEDRAIGYLVKKRRSRHLCSAADAQPRSRLLEQSASNGSGNTHVRPLDISHGVGMSDKRPNATSVGALRTRTDNAYGHRTVQKRVRATVSVLHKEGVEEVGMSFDEMGLPDPRTDDRARWMKSFHALRMDHDFEIKGPEGVEWLAVKGEYLCSTQNGTAFILPEYVMEALILEGVGK